MLNPNFIQPYTYTGREYDPETGLYYYRARYYDAEVGRFISEDPLLKLMNSQLLYVENIHFRSKFLWVVPILLEKPEYLSQYVYVGNIPTKYSDPNGLGWIDWIIKKIIKKFILKMCDNDNAVPEEGDDDGDGNPNFSDPDSPYCKINCTK